MPRSLGHVQCDMTVLTERAHSAATRRASQTRQIKRVGNRRREVPSRMQVRFKFLSYRTQRSGSTQRMMLEVDRDRTATGVTRAV